MKIGEYEHLKELERLSAKSKRLGKEILPLVEWLIQDYKELKKELEPIHKLGIPVETLVAEFDRLENLEDDTDCLKHRIKELEKEKDKLLEYYNERVQEIIDLKADSIPKSVIREKIEEVKHTVELERKKKWINAETIMKCTFQRDILKEILGEEK